MGVLLYLGNTYTRFLNRLRGCSEAEVKIRYLVISMKFDNSSVFVGGERREGE